MTAAAGPLISFTSIEVSKIGEVVSKTLDYCFVIILQIEHCFGQMDTPWINNYSIF